jgi:hypothetical protein
MKYCAYIILLLLPIFSVYGQNDDYVPLDERIKSNLFIKVEASNTDCFVGEPIIVTYKLYSALNSESSVIKNPSFKGFEVKDLKTDADAVPSREAVDRIPFDVHTVLKVQLIPQRSGKLVLDELVMHNNVKLIDANGRKDPLLSGVKESYSLSNGYYSLNIASVPLTILATGVPSSASPNASEIVGNFRMDVQLSKKMLVPQEEAALIITLTGNGHFDKIKMPEVKWPEDVQAFPPKIDKSNVDGSGYITYTIPFKTLKPGRYIIPSIKFSYYDIVDYRYKTITNIPIAFMVTEENGQAVHEVIATDASEQVKGWLVGGVLLILLLIVVLFIRYNQHKKRIVSLNSSQKYSSREHIVLEQLSVDDFLKPAFDRLNNGGIDFYITLKQCIIRYFEKRFGLPVALFTKDALRDIMQKEKIADARQTAILHLLTELDIHIYSIAGAETDRHTLLQKARELLLHL